MKRSACCGDALDDGRCMYCGRRADVQTYDRPVRFRAWNTVGVALRLVGDALAVPGEWVRGRLYGLSGTTDAIADRYR